MAQSLEWRIYYDDKSPFDSSNGPPENAPGWGVQAIIEPHIDVGRTITSRADYYIWFDGWLGVDAIGLIDHLINITQTVDFSLQIHSDSQFYGLYQYEGHVFNSALDLAVYLIEAGTIVKAGRMLKDRNEYRAILEQALSDSDFPNKSGWLQDEQAKKDIAYGS